MKGGNVKTPNKGVKEVMSMNGKAKKLKRELGLYKVSAIVNIVIAVVLWVSLAYLWGLLEAVRESLPWNIIISFLVTLILLGVFLLMDGILLLHFISNVAEVVKDVNSDEADK